MENEFKILEDANHPNIVRIYELLNDRKNYYIVGEYIKHGELFEIFSKR